MGCWVEGPDAPAHHSQRQEQDHPPQAEGGLNDEVHRPPPPCGGCAAVAALAVASVPCRQRTTTGLSRMAPLPSTRSSAFRPARTSTSARLLQLADLHLDDPPDSRFGRDQGVILVPHVQHAVGRHEERLPLVRSHSHLREHARSKRALGVFHDELHVQHALVLGDHRRYARHLAVEHAVGQGVETHLARHAELHDAHEPFRHFRDHDVALGGGGAEHGRFQAGLLKLPRQRGLGPPGYLPGLLLIANVLAALNLELDEVGPFGNEVFLRVRSCGHQLLHAGHDLLLGGHPRLVQIANRLELGLLILDVDHRLLPVGKGVQQIGGGELPGVMGHFLAGTQAGQDGPGHGQDRRGEPGGPCLGHVKFAVQGRARLDADRPRGGDRNGLRGPRGVFSLVGPAGVPASPPQVRQDADRHGQRQSQLNRQAGTIAQRAGRRLRARRLRRVRGGFTFRGRVVHGDVRHGENLPVLASAQGESPIFVGRKLGQSPGTVTLSLGNLFANRRVVLVKGPPIVGPAGNIEPIGVPEAALGVQHVDQGSAADVVGPGDAVADFGRQSHLLLGDRFCRLVGGGEVPRRFFDLGPQIDYPGLQIAGVLRRHRLGLLPVALVAVEQGQRRGDRSDPGGGRRENPRASRTAGCSRTWA